VAKSDIIKWTGERLGSARPGGFALESRHGYCDAKIESVES